MYANLRMATGLRAPSAGGPESGGMATPATAARVKAATLSAGAVWVSFESHALNAKPS